MTDKVKKLKQSLYGSDWKPEDGANINNLSENNKYIYNKAHSGSGYQPKAGEEFKPKKSISTNPPNFSTCREEVEECTKREYVSPAERALDMVSDYCMEKVRNYFFSNSPAEECNHKAEAYFDVRNFIQDYIEMHMADWEIQEKERNPVDENDELKHCKKEAKCYKKRMEQYRKSFFMVCNLIDTCGVPESIKYFVKQEELRY